MCEGNAYIGFGYRLCGFEITLAGMSGLLHSNCIFISKMYLLIDVFLCISIYLTYP